MKIISSGPRNGVISSTTILQLFYLVMLCSTFDDDMPRMRLSERLNSSTHLYQDALIAARWLPEGIPSRIPRSQQHPRSASTPPALQKSTEATSTTLSSPMFRRFRASFFSYIRSKTKHYSALEPRRAAVIARRVAVTFFRFANVKSCHAMHCTRVLLEPLTAGYE